jgi:hypothetical protein
MIALMNSAMVRTKTWIMVMIYTVSAYGGVAFTVFQWRNPLANKMTFWTEFVAVMRYEKLDRYQVK